MIAAILCVPLATSVPCYAVSGAQRADFNGKYCPDATPRQQGSGWHRPHRQVDGPGSLEYHDERHWFLTERYGRMFFKSDSTSLDPPRSGWERTLGGGKTEPALALSVVPWRKEEL